MEDKFHLTVAQNLEYAQRNVATFIWESSILEGLDVTFTDVVIVLNNHNLSLCNVSDVVAINNLKYGWRFVFDAIDCPTDFAYICELNRKVGASLFYNSGYIRTLPVSIGGTTWKPPMPVELDIKQSLHEISKIESHTERSITLMLYCMRTQMFIDGNKRTAMLAANHEMIRNGCGIISIPIEHQPLFMQMLAKFYETGDMETIKQFVYEYCIDGIAL